MKKNTNTKDDNILFRQPESLGQSFAVLIAVCMSGFAVVFSLYRTYPLVSFAVIFGFLLFGIPFVLLLKNSINARKVYFTTDAIEIRYTFLFWKNKSISLRGVVGYFPYRLYWSSRGGHGWIQGLFVRFSDASQIHVKKSGYGDDYQNQNVHRAIQILKTSGVPDLNPKEDHRVDTRWQFRVSQIAQAAFAKKNQ